jgi:hypothetical protein
MSRSALTGRTAVVARVGEAGTSAPGDMPYGPSGGLSPQQG